ncbi:MAG: hypothetical protein ACE37F_25190 [Nannocystaceae bacterium]|nr:hypothetical protein [bacterium]
MCTLDNFLASTDWGEVAVRLTAYALNRLRRGGIDNPDDAKDVVQEALRRLFDPQSRDWSPTSPCKKGLMRHLGSEINGIVANRVRLRMRRGDALPEDSLAKKPGGTRPDETDGLEDLVYTLLERVDGDDDASDILDLFLKGTEKASDQAETLKWTPSRVYEARRRIRSAASPENK